MESLTTVLDEIEEKLLSCPICIQPLKEPKLLPCLHRYCSDCLESYIKQRQGELECAVCRDVFTTPPEGFKTDYAVKNIVEDVHRKRSEITDVVTHDYIGCVNHSFERNGHLCQACYLWHQNKNVTKEDRPTIATLREISLKVNGIIHVQRVASDCVINDIRILAEKERIILRKKLRVSIGKRKSFYNMSFVDELIKGKDAYKKILSYQYACLRQMIQDEDVRFDVALAELETVIIELRSFYYERKHLTLLTNLDFKLIESMHLGLNNKHKLFERFGVLQKNYEDCKKCVEKNLEHEISNDLLARAYEVIKRYDELERSASEIIKSKNDWSVVEDFPEVCKSLDNLDKEMGKICIKIQNEILLKLKINNLGTYCSENKIKLVIDSLAEYHRTVPPRFRIKVLLINGIRYILGIPA